MRGKRTKWIFGTDHAGIATQVKVEEAAREEGKREETRARGLRRAGLGVAGAVRIDDHRAVQAARRVARLRRRALHDGRRLRARRRARVRPPLRQGPDLQRPLHGQLGPGHRARRSRTSRSSSARSRTRSTWSTTRSRRARARSRSRRCGPETMLADTAIAVNPADERYTRLIGEAAMLPLVGRRLPIIADEYVDPEFGTGALKITPGPRPERLRDRPPPRARRGHRDRRGRPHDRGGRRAFAGLPVPEARAAVVAALREAGRSCPAPSPTCTTCRTRTARATRIEPLISLQWFCDMEELAAPGDRGGPRRQRALPPRAPATRSTWAGWRTSGPGASRASSGGATRSPSGTATRARRPSSAREAPGARRLRRPLRRDPDVLDTWFSSALWPFATLGWPDETRAAARLLPDRRARHRARHHLPLGRPDGDDGHRVHRASSRSPTSRSPR